MLERHAVLFIAHGVGVKSQHLGLGLGLCEVPTDLLAWADNNARRWKHRQSNRSWKSQRERHPDCWQPLTSLTSLEVCMTCTNYRVCH